MKELTEIVTIVITKIWKNPKVIDMRVEMKDLIGAGIAEDLICEHDPDDIHVTVQQFLEEYPS